MTDPGTVEEAVSCTGLEYSFGSTKAVDGLDLSVAAGEVFGLLGPNGAGKTTAIRTITTLLPVPPGVVRVFGCDAARQKMAVRRLLGYVPQQLSADSGLTGRENVALFARVYDVPRKERAARVAEALETVGLTEAAGRLAGTYSGGMVRRLELAQALVSAPRLLILDEPTIGLDPIARTSVWERICEVRAATGMTVLVTTHYMDEADQYCDRLGLMHRGRIRALGTPQQLKDRLRRTAGQPGTRKKQRRHSRTSSGTSPAAAWVAAPTSREGTSAMSAAPGARRPASADAAPADPASTGTAIGSAEAAPDRRTGPRLLLTPPRARPGWQVGPARVLAMCLVELQKLRHDRTELYTRAVQPALWLVIFGETFTRIRAIPTGRIPYIDYLAPGIIAQSAMFIAIFYGIMIIWERDSGILTKLLVTPTPRAALVTGKAFAAGVKAVIQAVVVVVIAALLGVALTWNPLRLLGVALVVVLGSAFFSCLSMSIAGIVLTRDRLMGIGQVKPFSHPVSYRLRGVVAA